jgi:hypothetical protein
MDLQADDDFIKSVYGYRALNQLKARFPKSYASRFTRAQIEEMKQNVICRLGKTREHAFGKVRVSGADAVNSGAAARAGATAVVWSCRCEHTTCHAYEKCMSLSNALRIDRAELAKELEYMAEQGDEKAAEIGFDHDDCNFEPPHVTAVLPILNEVIAAADTEKHEQIQNQKQEVQIVEEEFSGSVAESAGNAMLDAYSELIPEIQWVAEKFGTGELVVRDKRVLIICENPYEAGYFSTVLYKNKVKHRTLRSEGYTLNRQIADVFWDYCGDEIDKESFLMRCSVRTNGEESEALEFYDALFKLCGDLEIGDEGGLKVTNLADALNESPDLISECVLNMDDLDCLVTVSTLESISIDDEYDEVMILEGENIIAMFSAVEELFGSPPTIIHKESHLGWVFSNSMLGRPCRVSVDNYTGEPTQHCLNIELGLLGDVDGKSFLTEQMGDAIRLQLYIAEKIREGDELTVQKNPDNGGFWFYHNGNMLGEFPEAIIREVRSIEGFPDAFSGFEGVYVRNIVTCVSEKDDLTVPVRFRESRIWLGLDITGYAKVLI